MFFHLVKHQSLICQYPHLLVYMDVMDTFTLCGQFHKWAYIVFVPSIVVCQNEVSTEVLFLIFK